VPARKRSRLSSAAEQAANKTPAEPGAPVKGRELRARGQRTMQRLLDAGVEVFATRGYHSARVDDIVKAAKTSHGTFYLYFSNKEDLFRTLVADVADELATLTASLGPVARDDEGLVTLRAWLDRFTEMYDHYGPVIRTWTEAEIDSNEIGRMGTDVLGSLTTALASRARPGRGVNPQLAAMAVVGMIERFNYFVLSGQVDARRDEMLDTLAGVVHRSLFAPS
jgi:AcrR family transcriptional regulator